MRTLNQYCKKTFGEKLYKLSLNGGMTCPNRDGTLGDRGCIFCSAGGSGDFAPAADLPLEEQIAQAKARIAPKFRGSRYIAYFQAYTNTYAPVERLQALHRRPLHRPPPRLPAGGGAGFAGRAESHQTRVGGAGPSDHPPQDRRLYPPRLRLALL